MAGIALRSLEFCCDSTTQSSPQQYFETLAKLTSLEALTIHTGCNYREHLLPLAQLTNLTSFTWELPEDGEYSFEDDLFHAVLPSWHKLIDLSLFHCARMLPPVPANLKSLHIQCLKSDSLFNVHLLPKGLIFNVDLLVLDCHNHGAAHTALANWEQMLSAGLDTRCSHLRLLCGRENERGSLRDVLPLLARHSHVFVKAGTHQVSAMHVKVMPGDVEKLAGLFDGVSKLGLIDYSLASLSVVEEAARLPGLRVLQLRFNQNSSRFAYEVHAAGVAGQGRQQPLALVIEFDFYPCDIDDDGLMNERLGLLMAWDDTTDGVPARVRLQQILPRFCQMPALNDEFC
eukprot:1160737-Pelagomonas_calceolata.AAC.1